MGWSGIGIARLRVNGLNSPSLGTTATPSLSWDYERAPDAWAQTGWSAEIGRYEADGSVTVTERIAREDDSSAFRQPWPFLPLRSRERVGIRVQAWGSAGVTPPSPWLPVEASLLAAEDWTARLVSVVGHDSASRHPIRLRRSFILDGAAATARLYGTARGVMSVTLNGVVVSDDALEPGWTAYESRLLFRAYDVSELLHPGVNTIGVVVADGWYAERYPTLDQTRGFYDGPLGALVQLEYDQGATRRVVATDASWLAAQDGPVVSATLYGGERHDARRDDEVLSTDVEWPRAQHAVVVDFDHGILRPAETPPIRVTEDVLPVSVTKTGDGRAIVDFGQNLVGRLSVRVQGQRDATVSIRHAEVLEDGELATRPLRNAEATDTYTFADDRVVEWEPQLTYHGFRYAEVVGWPEDQPVDIRARVLHTDLARHGRLRTGVGILDRFIENVEWSARGNSMSIPTDCPQRDERLGWTGDAQIFAAAAMFLFDGYDFFRSWLTDLASEQRRAGGVVPAVVPNVLLAMSDPAAGWGDAVSVIPWEMYWATGDPVILHEMFPAMLDWIAAIDRSSSHPDLWISGFQFGDWLDPSAPVDQPEAAMTSADLVASAYLYRTLLLTARVAAEIGKPVPAQQLRDRSERVRDAFHAQYLGRDGRLESHTQTAYAMFIDFGLGDADQTATAGKHLVQLVRDADHRVSTGFLGTAVVLNALSATGHTPDAISMLLQENGPSWLHPVTLGATTVWERWDSMRDDGSVNPGGMTSFNHYAFGAVMDWIRKHVGGVRGLTPGYTRIAVDPTVSELFPDVRCELASRHGTYAVRRTLRESSWRVEVVVPPGGAATIDVDGVARMYRSGEHVLYIAREAASSVEVRPALRR